MNSYKQLFVLIFLYLCLSTTALHAQTTTPIILTDGQEEYPVGLHLEILEDPGGLLTLEEVSSGTYDAQFSPSTQEVPNLGITPSTYWFRFRVRNNSAELKEWLLEFSDANIDFLTLYIPQPNQQYQEIKTGRLLSFTSRPLPYRYFVFDFSTPPTTEIAIYGKAASSVPLNLPLIIWSPQAFLRSMQVQLLRLGLVLGVLFIMAGYNLFLYFSLRDKSYLYYVLVICSLAGIKLIIEGLTAQYLGSRFVAIEADIELFLLLLMFLALLSFAKSFLITKTYAPRLDRLIVWLRWGLVVITLLRFIFNSSLPIILALLLMLGVSAVIILGSGVVAWYRGNRAARFFLLTWFIFLSQTTIYLTFAANLLKSPWRPISIDLAIVWLALFLSLALADRIRLLTREKEHTQAELLRHQQELLRLGDEYTTNLQMTNDQLYQTILEKEKAQQELKAHAKELERSNKDLQDFAYVASHDLQEPLRKIQAFGDRLQAKCAGELDEQGQDYIQRMQSAAARMQILIHDLLAFSQVTTKAEPFTPVNLTAVVQEVIQQLEVQIDAVSANIDVADLPKIEAERSQMYQLFQNLISNSLKFHRDDVPPDISITCDCLPGNNCCRILVTDNGIGFNEEYQERIFIIFQRLHNRDQYPGTGIGLAVCKKIVERHGGTIEALSRPDHGASFIITLPLSQN